MVQLLERMPALDEAEYFAQLGITPRPGLSRNGSVGGGDIEARSGGKAAGAALPCPGAAPAAAKPAKPAVQDVMDLLMDLGQSCTMSCHVVLMSCP